MRFVAFCPFFNSRFLHDVFCSRATPKLKAFSMMAATIRQQGEANAVTVIVTSVRPEYSDLFCACVELDANTIKLIGFVSMSYPFRTMPIVRSSL